MCLPAVSGLLKKPVLSSTTSMFISFHGRLAGSRSAVAAILVTVYNDMLISIVYRTPKFPLYGVVLEQMCQCFIVGKVVYGYYLHISLFLARHLNASLPILPKAVNCYSHLMINVYVICLPVKFQKRKRNDILKYYGGFRLQM